MNNKMNIPLSGIIPPLVTPLLDDDVLDVEGLQRLIEHLIAGGVHALFVLGTTGESQSLSYKLRMEMIKKYLPYSERTVAGIGMYFRYFDCGECEPCLPCGRSWSRCRRFRSSLLFCDRSARTDRVL